MRGRFVLGGMCVSMVSAAMIMGMCLDLKQGPVSEHYSEYNIEYSRYVLTNNKYLSSSVTSRERVQAEAKNAANVEELVAETNPEEIITNTEVVEEPVVNKVAGYGVYIDDAYVGVVSDKTPIEQYLNDMCSQFSEDETVIKVTTSHKVTFTDIEIEPELIDNDAVVQILEGLEDETEYVEIVPGSSLQALADKYGKTLEDMYSYPWLWNGDIVESKPENFKVGLLILVPTNKNYMRPIITKQEYVKQEMQYSTETLNDETLPIGYIQVVTPGVCGVQEVIELNTYDGKNLLNKEVLSTRQEVAPVTEVLLVGTKPNTSMATADGGSGDYFFPLAGGKWKLTAYMGDGRGHKGIDIAAPKGTEIYAAADGVISKVVTSGWGGGYGRHIIIDNADGKQCMYAHMSYVALNIAEGDEVKAGQLIGYVGSTGDSSGNHLHFEVRDGNKFKNPLNFVKLPKD